jgi:hypothetical protein
VLRGFVPAGRREPLQRRDQGAPEHLVVPLAEFSVRAPEFLQIRHEAVAVLLALLGSGDMAERLEETPALQSMAAGNMARISVSMAKSCA